MLHNPFLKPRVKQAFVPSDAALAPPGGMPPGGAPPMDPSMAGGMPPGMPPMDPSMGGMPPGAPPMDPSMGGMPPMDPSMGGMPPGMPPMDPAAGGGAPPTTTPPDPLAGGSPDIKQMIEQAVQDAISKTTGGAGGESAPKRGSGKGGDIVALQTDVYQMKQMMLSMLDKLGLEIPVSALDGPNHPAAGGAAPGGDANPTGTPKTAAERIKIAGDVLHLYSRYLDFYDDPWSAKMASVAAQHDKLQAANFTTLSPDDPFENPYGDMRSPGKVHQKRAAAGNSRGKNILDEIRRRQNGG